MTSMLATELAGRLCCLSGRQFNSKHITSIFFQNFIRNMSGPMPQADVGGAEISRPKSKPGGMAKSFREVYNMNTVNLQVKEDSTPYCAKVIHPGLAVESIGRNGHPSLTSILQVASACRVYSMHMPVDSEGRTFFEYDKLTSKCFTFVSSTLVNISAHMYDSNVPKFPLEVKVEGGHVGRTSLSTVSGMTSLRDPEKRELMNQVNQVVLVDKGTRRPIPLEEKWKTQFEPHCIRNEPLIIKRQDTPEAGALSVYETKVAWSDTDNYNHTNFTSYARFAVDAVHDALRLGKLGEGEWEEVIAAGVAQLKIAYIGECVEGDVLSIQVWAVEGTERTLLCSMEKQGQVVNQVTLTYHDPATAL